MPDRRRAINLALTTVFWSCIASAQPIAADRHWMKAAYVWDSRALLSPQTRTEELDELHASRFTRIYLGLNARQLENLALIESGVASLVSEARAMGITVDLLLGDPAWMKAEHRHGLIALIRRLQHVPFEHLHLDLEVEQLQWPVPDELLQAWIDTLSAAVKSSPWPVSLVSHHRWFTPGQSGAGCVPCVLPSVGVNRVSLMIYTTNESRMTSLAAGIARGWPELNFAIAQSVEHHLPRINSWHGHSADSLENKNQIWKASLSPLGIAGLEWQNWFSYPQHKSEANSIIHSPLPRLP